MLSSAESIRVRALATNTLGAAKYFTQCLNFRELEAQPKPHILGREFIAFPRRFNYSVGICGTAATSAWV
jgi:hypothetical protein